MSTKITRAVHGASGVLETGDRAITITYEATDERDRALKELRFAFRRHRERQAQLLSTFGREGGD